MGEALLILRDISSISDALFLSQIPTTPLGSPGTLHLPLSSDPALPSYSFTIAHSGHAVQKNGFVLGFLHIPVSALLYRYIVFEGEEGQDAGGLLREWYMIISREMFNPMYALFRTSPGDRVTYTINPSSHCNPNHLSYFKFVGRIVAKAVYDNRLLECYFTRSFYKHILGKSVR